MTLGGRIVALGVAAALAFGGFVTATGDDVGWGLVAAGALVAASVLFERRYRLGSRSGASAAARVAGTWQRTGEREFDSETGEALEAWFDEATGERRYEPIARSRPG